MKKFLVLILAAAALLSANSCCNCGDEYGYVIKNGVAVYNTPARPADQVSMIGFAAEPIEKVRVGFMVSVTEETELSSVTFTLTELRSLLSATSRRTE